MGSLIRENINKSVKSLALPDKFIFENLGREKLLDQNNLSVKNIGNKIKALVT